MNPIKPTIHILWGLAVAVFALAGCNSQSSQESWTLQKLLSRATPLSQSELVKMAASGDPDLRRQAIVGLSKTRNGLGEPYIKLYALFAQDENATVRSAAVRALGSAGRKEHLGLIIGALGDPSAKVRADAAAALEEMPNEQAVATLGRVARRDADEDVRIACVKALSGYRSQDALRALVACLKDESYGVQFHAHQNLVHMTGQDFAEREQWASVDLAKCPAPVARPSRPWWDWAGVTSRWNAVSTTQPPIMVISAAVATVAPADLAPQSTVPESAAHEQAQTLRPAQVALAPAEDDAYVAQSTAQCLAASRRADRAADGAEQPIQPYAVSAHANSAPGAFIAAQDLATPDMPCTTYDVTAPGLSEGPKKHQDEPAHASTGLRVADPNNPRIRLPVDKDQFE